MNPRLEAYSRKLEESLCSNHRFPINLEWLVDLFKYKHISSLTTHLKRHFLEKTDYKRIPEGQNKRTWSYHITVDCFMRICHYCRHSERKIVAKYWLRKANGSKRDSLSSPSCSPSASEEDERDEENEDEEEEQEIIEGDDETEEDTTGDEDQDDGNSTSTSPENSPRNSLSPSQPTILNTMTVQIPPSDLPYSLDWSYLKLRSYDIASLYHLHPFHYVSHPSCCGSHQALSIASYELFNPSSPSSPSREDFVPDTSFDTNAFLSIPDEDSEGKKNANN